MFVVTTVEDNDKNILFVGRALSCHKTEQDAEMSLQQYESKFKCCGGRRMSVVQVDEVEHPQRFDYVLYNPDDDKYRLSSDVRKK